MKHFLPVFFLSTLLLGLSACQDKPVAPPDAVQSTLVSDLLAAANTLPPEAVVARVTQLPDVYQDSFFTKRLAKLEGQENLEALKQTLEVFKKARPGQALTQAEDHYYQGVFCQYAGKFDSAEMRYALAVAGYEQLGEKRSLSKALDSRSGNLGTQGRYDEAISMKYRALALIHEIGDVSGAMLVQSHLANVFNFKGDYDRSIALLDEPIAHAQIQKDTNNWAYRLGAKGNAYLGKKDLNNALVYHGQALALRQKQGATAMAGESLYHYGRTLVKLKRWQEALDTLRSAEKAIKTTSNKQGQGFVNAAIGESLFNLGRYQEANDYLVGSLALSMSRKQYPSAVASTRMLSAARKATGNYAEALQYHEQYLTFKDSMFGQEKDKLSHELTVKYETREKEQQIASLQKENALATQRNWWIGGSLLSLAMFGLFVVRQRARRKQEQLEKTLELQRIELESNQILLNDYTQMLLERNSRIEALAHRQDAKHLSSDQLDSPGTDRAAAEQLYQAIIDDTDWEQFQLRFSKVYPSFIPEIRQQMPSLTAGELRLLMLGKMGLSLKQSAVLLGIESNSVKMGRYRLRKKLQEVGAELAGLLAD